jgi:TusA-related sulfurtransferase|tara:strand:+ start:222 stop:455 length:234 start_codon:yes stop_codon:yes gene_type:complete
LKKVSKLLDLESIPCPLNVVKCKLALEKLSLNETLIVHLDKGEPEIMVKRALKEMKYFFKTIEENQKTIKFKILHES